MDLHRFGDHLRQRIAANLAEHPRLDLHRPELRRAAVAITVVPAGSGLAGFVLTRRSASLRAHSAQYALPGGRVDAGETDHEAARRELLEEVGLVAQPADVLGELDDYRTRSGYVITPVVVWLDDISDLAAQPSEVDEVFVVELAELDRPDSPRWVDIEESERRVLQLPIGNQLVHAPTGALLYQFRDVAIHGRLTRTDEVEEPVWAWR